MHNGEDEVAPGWYPDTHGNPRWWNGQRWTTDEPDDGAPAKVSRADASRVPRALAIVALSVGGLGTLCALASVVACMLSPH